MFFGSLSALAGMPPVDVPLTAPPGTPDVVAPEVLAPLPAPGVVAVAALSSVGVVSSAVLAHPARAANTKAAMIHLRMKCLLD